MNSKQGTVIDVGMQPNDKSPSQSFATDGNSKSSKRPIVILLAVIASILLCVNLYVAFSTSYASSFPLNFDIQTCSAPASPTVAIPTESGDKILSEPTQKYNTELGNTSTLQQAGNINPADPAENINNAINNYRLYLTLWSIILVLGVLYSSGLLIFFVAVGEQGLQVIRKYIIIFGVVTASIAIFLESALIYLAYLILRSGGITTVGEETRLQLAFSIRDVPKISVCLVDPTINIFWNQGLIIAAPVFVFITFTMLAVLVYLKVSMTDHLTRPSELVPAVESGTTTTLPSPPNPPSSFQSTAEDQMNEISNRFLPFRISISSNNHIYNVGNVTCTNETVIDFEEFQQQSITESSHSVFPCKSQTQSFFFNHQTPTSTIGETGGTLERLLSIEIVNQPSLDQEPSVQAVEKPVLRPPFQSSINNDTVIDIQCPIDLNDTHSNEEVSNVSLEQQQESQSSDESSPVPSPSNDIFPKPQVVQLEISKLEEYSRNAPIYAYKANPSLVGKLKASQLDPFRFS